MTMATMQDGKHLYESTWQDALSYTKTILGEDDFELIQNFQTPEQLLYEVQQLQQQNTAQSTVTRLLRNARPHLVHLHTFATFLAVAAGANISFTCMWGVTYLLMSLGSKSEKAMEEIAGYLRDFSEQIELFQVYSDKSVQLEGEFMERFFSLLVDLLVAGALAIKHLRKHGGITGTSWTNVNRQFTKAIQDFTHRLAHLRQLVEAHRITEMSLQQTELLESLSKYSITQRKETAKLPYYQLPFARNHNFFGRADVIQSIHDALQEIGNDGQGQQIRSVALWGTGGIGKSQIALEYANLQVLNKCQLVLWLPTQTEIDLSRALVHAASEIRPAWYEDGMPTERVRFLMWNWLQTTGKCATPPYIVRQALKMNEEISWTIIFDNVDDNNLLTSNWPAAGNGQILVTCRSELVAACPAATANTKLPAEIEAAQELSSMLGGLALAIDITAKQIFVKKKTMRQFLPYFKKNKQSLRVPPRYASRNPYYNENLVTVWQTAFDSLTKESGQLLALMCFFAPDDIPSDIIHTTEQIPGTWDFLSDLDGYEDAVALLLHQSLIKINSDTGMISLHRLTQEAYYYHLTEKERHDTFHVAYRILCAAFPKRTLRRQMYEVWETCEMLIHHIETAQDKYEDLRPTGLDVQDLEYHTMLADAAWFCSETSSLQLGETIGRRAADNCADKNSLIYAYLCESVATVDHRRGRYLPAYKFFLQSLEIREKEPSTTGPELADAYSAVGLALFGLFKCEEAIEAVQKALDLVYKAPKELQSTYNIDRYLRNHSRPSAALGRLDVAKNDMEVAEKFQTEVYGEDSHFHGETAYILGKIAYTENDLESARRYIQRAYDLQYPGKPTHQSVASALYHQALVCLRRSDTETDPEQQKRNDEQALEYLRDALRITQFNEPRRGDQGESARVKWQISKIWERQGRTADASTYKASALRAKLELEKTGLHPVAPDEEQGWDAFTDVVDR
ncbi:Tetratricopeptide-like helical [Penicillium vulpinum]|uniref:Tetratricopeptide-like helical n=1 Tax=Penicillium vulpinum TaxID=29845 RepID=UPI00254807FF|nr:Tetratricopeptide-like helical [Penicillium vulpinum]KAJ5959309.1 Tetratricopeptide-like helical [Penicillium vulpinum]